MKRVLTFIFSIFVFVSFSIIAVSQTVTPQKNGSRYTLQVANVAVEIDPDFAGRPMSLKYDNKEIFFTENNPGSTKYLTGASLWPSPQSWPWPPASEFDTDPFKGGIVNNSIVLRGETDPNTKVAFKRVMYADLSDTSITMEYTLFNKATATKKWAIWELTRVPCGGISFFPKGENDPWGALADLFSVQNDIIWYPFSKGDKSGRKFYCDGKEGWSAHVNDDNILFIKKFDDQPLSLRATDNENEVELWLDSKYIELENQGAYTSLNAGDSTTWKVKWYVRALPSGAKAEVGNQKMIDFVRSVVTRLPVGINKTSAVNQITATYNSLTKQLKINNLKSNADLMVYDLSGKLTFRQELNQKNNLDLSKLKKGIYIYSIVGEQVKKSGKLVVE